MGRGGRLGTRGANELAAAPSPRPGQATLRLCGDGGSRLRKGVLAGFHYDALSRRYPAIGHGDLVEHLEIRLPAVRRHDVAHKTTLIVDEFCIRLLLHACLEGLVDVEAIAI